jgi:hypothetical protein
MPAPAVPPSWVGGGFADGLGGLELGVLGEVAEHAHAGALVEGFLDGGRQGDVFDEHLGEFEAVDGELGLDAGGDEMTKLIVIGGEVEDGDLDSPRMSVNRETIMLRSWSVISPVVKRASVPTISRTKAAGSCTRMT